MLSPQCRNASTAQICQLRAAPLCETHDYHDCDVSAVVLAQRRPEAGHSCNRIKINRNFSKVVRDKGNARDEHGGTMAKVSKTSC